MSEKETSPATFRFDLPLPHSDITLLEAVVMKAGSACIVELRMWVRNTQRIVTVPLDLERQEFTLGVRDARGRVDEEATIKLKLQRYAIAGLVRKRYADSLA